MKQHFPEYRFDTSDSEWIRFRKNVTPTLDLLLRFNKVHQWGLGKTFTIDLAVDFPGHALSPGAGKARRNSQKPLLDIPRKLGTEGMGLHDEHRTRDGSARLSESAVQNPPSARKTLLRFASASTGLTAPWYRTTWLANCS
jgi:hypothetical protein